MSIKGATSISKHNTNKSINLDSSSSYPIARDSYQISNLKEEESNELLESLPAKITQIKPKESLVSLDNSKYEKEEYTNNINIISNLEKSKSLEYKYEISAVESKHKPFESKEVSKDKTVRFKDSIKHSRQSSELDNYIENKKKLQSLFDEPEGDICIQSSLKPVNYQAQEIQAVSPSFKKEFAIENVSKRPQSPNTKYSNEENVGAQSIQSLNNQKMKTKIWRFLFISLENIFSNALVALSRIKDIRNMSNKFAIKHLAMKSIIFKVNQRETVTKANAFYSMLNFSAKMKLMDKEKELFDFKFEKENYEKQIKEHSDKVLYLKVCNDSLAEKCKIIKSITEEWNEYSSNILS